MLRRIKLIACRCLCLLQGKLLLFGISKAEDQVFAADDVPGLITPYYSLAVVQSELRIGKILIVYLVLSTSSFFSILIAASFVAVPVILLSRTVSVSEVLSLSL